MGAMTAKETADGFLYYRSASGTRGSPSRRTFHRGDARSWTTYHGDGAWTCVGPDGQPLPTQRLENFRDGLEEYAYVRELEVLLKTRASPGTSGLDHRGARRPACPRNAGRSLKAYKRDPAAVLAWRDRLAELIERAPAR
jgi:hypothetical protein